MRKYTFWLMFIKKNTYTFTLFYWTWTGVVRSLRLVVALTVWRVSTPAFPVGGVLPASAFTTWGVPTSAFATIRTLLTFFWRATFATCLCRRIFQNFITFPFGLFLKTHKLILIGTHRFHGSHLNFIFKTMKNVKEWVSNITLAFDFFLVDFSLLASSVL